DRPEGEGTQSGRPESGGDPGGRAGQPRPDTPPSDPTDQPIDNPGEAFEKALEYIRQKQADQLAEADPREGQPRGGDPAGQTTPDGPAADSPGRSEPQAPADGDPPAGGPTGGDPPGGPSSDQAGESGAEASQAQPSTETDSRQPSGGSDQPSSADSRPDQVPGGGRGNQGQQPPAVPEGENRPRDKGGTAGQSKADQEPADSSVSRQQSDSAPGEEGSRAGQGDEGGGQRAAKEGEGAAGQQTPADSGDQASSESGPGETGARAGDKVPADRPTGQPGDPSCPACQRAGGACSACKGSGGRSGGSSAAGQPGAKPPGDGQPGATPGQPQGAGQPSPAQPGEGPAGDARGGGNFAGQDRTPGAAGAETPRQEPGADDANLQYARQQTELVLDYLQEQLDRGGVDQELKERFGWSDQQFADFVRRYGDLRARAKSAGEEGRAARQELDDTLRSLGLRRPAAELRSGRPKIDKAEGLQQSGRARPPQEYQEQFDAFRRDAFADE
ncbi:MAG: hypothetical protein GTO53_11435, partial [Planctomycetales bacterium]|nr:hypothetical protein [Planctomycetales bacterium]NIM09726.1 hypothetical protein [Planctomycetales bacterium]NIN09201.1 hypothetical protein [Planctomycetales bacterium]NIN78298.1 hypothetical protein [Planctomycetales bacterium]NIO35482.1 hypothetical protein [Planctomycetales bacterium]